MKPTLLVTGGSSSLGRKVVLQAASDWRVVASYWNNPQLVPPGASPVQLDLCDAKAVQRCLAEHQPQAIIHTAGSNRPLDMEQLIITGTRHITQAAAAHNARLVHISTDVIFDGTQAPYTESDPPNPVHAYGRAKAAAEEIVAASGANAVIARTSLIYGFTGDCHTSNWLLEANRTSQETTLFTDEFRSPIWVKSLAAACLELAQHPFQGVLHVAGAQRVDRWELGSKLLRAMGQELNPNIHPGTTPPVLAKHRPQDCTLDTSLAREILRTLLPGLDQALKEHAPAAR